MKIEESVEQYKEWKMLHKDSKREDIEIELSEGGIQQFTELGEEYGLSFNDVCEMALLMYVRHHE